MVNRVRPDDQLLEKGMRFAQRLAAGPTKAHAATKRIVRAYLQGGVDEADRVTPEVAGDAVRDRGPAARRQVVSHRRAGQCHVRGR